MIGGNESAFVGPRNALARDLRVRAIGAHDHSRLHDAIRVRLGAAEVNERTAAAGQVFDTIEAAIRALGACKARALAEPFIVDVSVDHADVAAVDGHVHGAIRRRDDACRIRSRDDEFVRDVEVADQPWRNRTAARLDASRTIDEQHVALRARQGLRGGGAGGASADDHGIVGRFVFGCGHLDSSPFRVQCADAASMALPSSASVRFAPSMDQSASAAAAMKAAASMPKTMA